MEAGPLKWLQKWKERKRLKQRQSTRQLMGIRKLLPHGVAIPGGSLVFFLIHPDNLSVLSAEGIRQRVTALSNLFRAEEQVEVLALDSRVSFQQNQAVLSDPAGRGNDSKDPGAAPKGYLIFG